MIGAEEHRELARDAVRRSLVLMKDPEGLLLSILLVLIGLRAGADDIGPTGGWTIAGRAREMSMPIFQVPDRYSMDLFNTRKPLVATSHSMIKMRPSHRSMLRLWLWARPPMLRGGDIETLAWQQDAPGTQSDQTVQ